MASNNSKKDQKKKGIVSTCSNQGSSIDGFDEAEALALLAARPWLVRKEHNDLFGNHFIAKELITKGRLIGIDKPVLQVTLDPHKCSQCLTRLDDASNNKTALLVCPHHKDGVCGEKYCSTECQKVAWESYHKVQDAERLGSLVQECKGGVTNTRHIQLMVVKFLSMYQLPEKNKVLIALIDSLLVNHKISELVSPKDPTRESSLSRSLQIRIAAALAVLIPDIIRFVTATSCAIPSRDFLDENTDHLARVCYHTNRLRAPTADTGWIKKVTSLMVCYVFGTVDDCTLMGDTNYFNHSCVPNASVNVDERYILATRDIPAGEQVFICYFDLDNLTPPATRRKALKEHHGFVCHCELCVADEESPTCDYCRKTTAEAGVARLRYCTACKGCRYCGRDCQAKHWSKHKEYCNKLNKIQKQQGYNAATGKFE